MKRKPKVFLRLSKKSHPLYEELWKYPPKEIKYVFRKDLEHYSKNKVPLARKVRNFIWTLFLKIGVPIVPFFREDCDLIHSTNSISLISNKPWVLDAEVEHGMVGLSHWKEKSPIYRFIVRAILKQKNCKKIMLFSDHARESFLRSFGEEFRNKVETVHAAQHINKSKKRIKKRREVTLIFMARKFEEKGGYEVLEVFNKLKKENKCKLIMVSNFPGKIKKACLDDEDILLVKGNLQKDELSVYLQKADIFIYPSRTEANYGTVLLDAMANKLPVVANNFYATPEVIQDGKNGFLVNPLIKLYDFNGRYLQKNDQDYLLKYKKIYQGDNLRRERYLNEIYDKTLKLIKDPKLRRKMGERGFKLVSKGKFSIGERNKKLVRIYREALKS